jgi:hypothetical protein
LPVIGTSVSLEIRQFSAMPYEATEPTSAVALDDKSKTMALTETENIQLTFAKCILNDILYLIAILEPFWHFHR